MTPPKFLKLLLLVLLLVAPLASALESDRQQKVDVIADNLDHDDKKGVTTLTGNVELEQGTLKIDAQRAILYRESGVLTRVEIFGGPAHLEQVMDEDQGLMKARANYMDYLIGPQTLAMRDNVVVDQGQRRLTGDEIDYDMANGQVKGSGESRVRMSFPPPEPVPAATPEADGTSDSDAGSEPSGDG